MNKLQEAGNKVRERIYNLADSEGKLNFSDLDMIEETVREVCSEYARSKVPSERISTIDSSLEAQDEGYELCRDEMLDSIDQDLQSLNNLQNE